MKIYKFFKHIFCFQGGIGWWMVKSGLHPMFVVNREDGGWKDAAPPGVPRVSQYRLAVHLGLAFVLYTMFVYTGLTYLLKPHDVNQFDFFKNYEIQFFSIP